VSIYYRYQQLLARTSSHDLGAFYLHGLLPNISIHMTAFRVIKQHPELCYVLLHRAPLVYPVLVVDVLEECQCGTLEVVLDYPRLVLPDIITRDIVPLPDKFAFNI
jgi:hypothetical protein